MAKDRDVKSEVESEGIIFLVGDIDEGKCEAIAKQIVMLNLRQEQPFIQMIINSHGGYTSAGFAIIDIMEWSRMPVYTTGIGLIASMGLLIFMSGQRGHRVVTPRTSILSHRYVTIVGGNHSDLIAHRKEEDLMHQRIVNHYLQHSNLKTEEALNQKVLRDVDTWLTPEQAMEYGMADQVQSDLKEPYPHYKISSLRGGAL